MDVVCGSALDPGETVRFTHSKSMTFSNNRDGNDPRPRTGLSAGTTGNPLDWQNDSRSCSFAPSLVLPCSPARRRLESGDTRPLLSCAALPFGISLVVQTPDNYPDSCINSIRASAHSRCHLADGNQQAFKTTVYQGRKKARSAP